MLTATSHYSVLVVEDNPDLVIGLQDLLHHEGYAVTIAGTVAGAIELVRAHRFNTILLDLGLPDGDGLEVLKETHRLDPSVPIVIVTADISRDRTVGLLREGAFAYLTKPYDREEILHTLCRAIGVEELAVKVERTEHLLSQSEERLELVIQGSNDGFWDGRVLPDEPWSSPRTPVWWSPRVKAMRGIGTSIPIKSIGPRRSAGSSAYRTGRGLARRTTGWRLCAERIGSRWCVRCARRWISPAPT